MKVPKLSNVLDGIQIVSQGTAIVSNLAPLVIDAMQKRDYEAMASYAAVLATGRKVGLASTRTVELFVRAIASLSLDVKAHRENHPLSVFREDRP